MDSSPEHRYDGSQSPYREARLRTRAYAAGMGALCIALGDDRFSLVERVGIGAGLAVGLSLAGEGLLRLVHYQRNLNQQAQE